MVEIKKSLVFSLLSEYIFKKKIWTDFPVSWYRNLLLKINSYIVQRATAFR